MDLEKRYKAAVESNQENPPEALWESIQEDLDLEHVWGRLETSLSEPRKVPLWVFQAVAASIALLIGFSAWFLWPGKPTIAPLNLPARVQTEVPWESSEGILTEEVAGIPKASAYQVSNPSQSPLNRNELRIDLAWEGEIKEILQDSIYLTALDPVKEEQLTPSEDTPPGLEKPNRTLEEEFLASLEPEPMSHRFSIGILGQFANTWLLNAKTLQGLQSKELTATHPTFGKNIGLSLLKPINRKISLKGDLMFLSQSRQNYNEYLSGQYTSTSLQLDYSSLSLMFRFRPGTSGSPHSFQLGGYAGTLVQAREVTGQNMLIVKDHYAKTDLGLIGGYEYSFPISQHFFLATGFYAKYGLTNAFSGNQQIPEYLNRTHNAAFIFSFSVNYSVK